MSSPSAPVTPTRRRGPRPSVPEVAPEQLRLLQRLQRLRVLTPFQAHWLVDEFHATNPSTGRARTERNTRMRLQQMAEEGFITGFLTHPEKGGYSGVYYRLAGKGLRTLGLQHEKSLLRRPPHQVLRYLLLRNEVYARARAAGWHVISPVLSPDEVHGELLARFGRYVRRQLEERVRNSVPGAELDLQRLETFLPSHLSFDCLLQVDQSKRREELVLVVVDDPRRAVVKDKRRKPRSKPTRETCNKCGALMRAYSTADRAFLRCTALRCNTEKELPSPASAQIEDLPRLLPNARLLLRDTQSRWNATTGALELVSPRLRQWRRLLTKRYGEEFVATDSLFPDVWAQRTGSPPSPSSNSPPQSNLDVEAS